MCRCFLGLFVIWVCLLLWVCAYVGFVLVLDGCFRFARLVFCIGLVLLWFLCFEVVSVGCFVSLGLVLRLLRLFCWRLIWVVCGL